MPTVLVHVMDTLNFPFEIKSIDDAGHIEGVAAGIGDIDNVGDRIMPGAFTKTLADRGGQPVPMLLHHDMRRPIGAWSDLSQTKTGLHAKGKITLASRDGADAHALAKDRALTGLSIGYRVEQERKTADAREIHALKLFEISLVAVPAHDRGRLHAVKSISNVDDIRDLLQEAGMSGRQAKAAAGAAWRAIHDTKNEPDAAELAAIIDASAARIAAL